MNTILYPLSNTTVYIHSYICNITSTFYFTTGNFGVVHKARYTKDFEQHDVAIKTLKGYHSTYCVYIHMHITILVYLYTFICTRYTYVSA